MSINAASVLRRIFFDEDYYLAEKAEALAADGSAAWTAGDVAAAFDAAGMSAWEHFVRYGAYELNADGTVGIDPSRYFSTHAYYDDLARATSLQDAVSAVQTVGDPITHYATQGYLEVEVTAVQEGARCTFATPEEFSKTWFFDEIVYLTGKTAALNVDNSATPWTIESTRAAMAKAGMTPWEHFVRCGAFELNADGDLGIDPSEYFDVSHYYQEKAEYLETSASAVANAMHACGLDPITHYARYGLREKMVPRATGFDAPAVDSDTVVPPLSGHALVDSILYRDTTWPSLAWRTRDDGIAHYRCLTEDDIAYCATPERVEELRPLREEQKAAFLDALDMLHKITGIPCREATSLQDADLLFMSAVYDDAAADVLSTSLLMGDWTAPTVAILLNENIAENLDPRFGSPAFESVCHELGHAFGLQHPFSIPNPSGGYVHPALPESIENTAWTIMSYARANEVTDTSGTPVAEWCTDGSFYYSPIDVLALQYLYGTDEGAA